MFDTLGERLNKALDGVRGSGNLTEDQVKKVTREIRLALLETDVDYSVVKEFVSNVRERATGAEVSKALSPGQQVVKIVDEELANLMGGTAHKLSFASRLPTVVMLAGLNGHGKTTAAGKLALFVRKLGKNPYLVACDTYRPAAIEQLQQIGRELSVPVYTEGTGPKPEEIAERGIREARDGGYDFVIVHTARQEGLEAALRAASARRGNRPERRRGGGGLPGVRRLRRDGPDQARRRRPRRGCALRGLGYAAADQVRLRGREDGRVRLLLPGQDGRPHPGDGRCPHAHREGRKADGPYRGRGPGQEAHERKVHLRGLLAADADDKEDGPAIRPPRYDPRPGETAQGRRDRRQAARQGRGHDNLDDRPGEKEPQVIAEPEPGA